MKPEQIEKRINWLDEQHRKGVDLIDKLETRFKETLESLNAQDKKIKDFASELTRLSALASRIEQFDDALMKLRDDFSKKLIDKEQLFSEKQQHLEALRKKDFEELSKSLSEMRMKQEETEMIKDSIEARKIEESRISREMIEMEEKVEALIRITDEHTRHLNSAEEVKRLDARRITDLQSEATELRTKIDTVRGKQDAIEDRIRRSESRIEEIAMNEASRREAYTLWEEKQELRVVDFEKNWKEWKAILEEFEKKANAMDEKILKFDENFRALEKAKSELDKIIERLQRRTIEISEIQRIAEERSKQEWAGFQADQQKSWNTYKLTNDEMWREHSRIHKKINEEWQVLDKKLSQGLETLEDLAEKSQNRVIDLMNLVKVWADEIEKKISEIR